MLNFLKTATDLGKLLEEKNHQYGNSYIIVPDILRILYPTGIKPHQYGDTSIIIRILDKINRRANGNSDAAEDWRDIGGYGIVKLAEILEEKEAFTFDNVALKIVDEIENQNTDK